MSIDMNHKIGKLHLKQIVIILNYIIFNFLNFEFQN